MKILYADEEDSYLDALRQRYGKENVQYVNDLGQLGNYLDSVRGTTEEPDILLLDIYWPHKDADHPEVQRVREKTERLKEEVIHRIKDMSAVYQMEFSPRGIKALAEIRKKYLGTELPIVLYTSKGHFLLSDPDQDWLTGAVEHGAAWLCKGTASKAAEDGLFKLLTQKKKKGIFIGHGHSKEWQKLEAYLEDFKLPIVEFNSKSSVGQTIPNRLMEMVVAARFGFLIMTAEDEHGDSTLHARENVIHEIGLCQASFGCNRTAILLEQGCEKFTNIEGLIHIEFPKDNINKSFPEVKKVLVREGMLPDEIDDN